MEAKWGPIVVTLCHSHTYKIESIETSAEQFIIFFVVFAAEAKPLSLLNHRKVKGYHEKYQIPIWNKLFSFEFITLALREGLKNIFQAVPKQNSNYIVNFHQRILSLTFDVQYLKF